MSHKTLSLFSFALIAAPLAAQVSFGGEPLGTMADKLGFPAPPVVEFPKVDAAALMLEDMEREASGVKGPWRFGFNHATDLTLENSGAWSTMANGDRIWRITLHCPGAFSINFEFNTFILPEGAQVFVWNERGDHLGAFTAASNPGHTELGVGQLPGDRITIEYHLPAAVASQGELRIGQVTHAYRDIFKELKGLGDSGSCNNNVICPEGDDWRDQIASVAMITVGGSGICTGQLLNNCNNDGTPYFLTANHCTSGGVTTWVFRFNWESPTCTPTTNGPTTQTVSGSSLLASGAGSDYALLLLNSTPPTSYGVYYSGWDATGNTPANQTCIHHPSGDIKKISFDNQSAGQATWSGAACWHIFNWDDGTTEPGSSGSGLWNQDHRLIGQLFGGTASCSNNIDDYFGRFAVSYPSLTTWLGAGCGTTVDGYDPNYTPVPLDAGIPSISGVDASYCNANSIAPDVTLKNFGTTTLTSVNIYWNLDGGPNTLQAWSGSLATGATAVINLGGVAVSDGDHTLTVFTAAPNGGVDAYALNDQSTRDFHNTTPAQTITLHIQLDNYPEETSWELALAGGSVVATGGTYGAEPDMGTVDVPLCVGNGCYELTFNDDAGDGICCGYGLGNFNVHDQWGTTYVTNDGQYGNSVVETFCITNTGIGETASAGTIQIAPNPASTQVVIGLPCSGELANITISDAAGRVVRVVRSTCNGPMPFALAGIAEGIYSIAIDIGPSHAIARLAVRQ